MSLTDALQRAAFSPQHLGDLDASPGFFALGMREDGQTCRRCEGKGWFQWHGVARWCRPSCIAPHVDVDLLYTLEARSQIRGL